MDLPFPTLKQIVSGLLCAVLVMSLFSGCSSEPTGKTFRYDMESPVENLDPQFATDSNSKLILANLFEGLLVATPEGDYQPGVAERYTVSSDRLTYTFHLRGDATWEGGDPVTAHDFAFTFRRMFRDGSPHADKYTAIRGSDALRAGTAASLSGVQAQNDSTLVIQLEAPDPYFLEKLCEPAAAPCHRKTFEESRGRYGLELKFVIGNGPFTLSRWDNTRLNLTKSETYRSEKETLAGGVVFYFGREAAAQFTDGKSDIALLTREEQERVSGTRYDLTPIQKTVWCIVFNQDHRIWGSALLRQGLALSIDHQILGEQAPLGFQLTSVLVPDSVRVMGKPYRPFAFQDTPLEFDTQRAARLFALGLDSLDLRQLPSNATILIPDTAKELLGTDQLQQSWQKYLSAYINFEVTTPGQIQTRLRSGDYQMLLMPITPGDASISTLLEAFTSQSSQNYFGYRNVRYDDLMQTAAIQSTSEAAAEKYAQAETMLLSDAVVIPLFQETSYLGMARDVEGLWVSAFGDRIYFKYGLKNG